MLVEQAGVGAVDAGETNQRGGNPNVLHLSSPCTIEAVERETAEVPCPNTSFGGLDSSIDACLHHCGNFSVAATCAAEINPADLQRRVDCETTFQ
jgi:hypothetical protein